MMSKNLDGKTKQQSLTNFFTKKAELTNDHKPTKLNGLTTSPCIFNKFEKIVSYCTIIAGRMLMCFIFLARQP